MTKEIEENEAEDVIVVTEPIKIEDGKHEGKIVNVVRNLPNEAEGRIYDYIDIGVDVLDVKKEPTLRIGFPTNISELSVLGRLLKKAGLDFTEGQKITTSDIKDTLIDREISFLSKNEKTNSGEFARILRDTIEFK